MTQGAIFFLRLRGSAIQEHRTTKPVAASRPARHSDTHSPKHPQRSEEGDPGMQEELVKGLLQHAAPAQSLGSTTPARRARNAAHPIRRSQGARPWPHPLSPLPSPRLSRSLD